MVADEVRNLAQRCADAARQTTALIGESLGRSADGKKTMDLVDGSIRSSTQDTATLKAIVEELDASSREQARGIDQVSRAITQM